ncbi:DUF4142 domain-containing protein [Pseudonocardia bannensis]|uniref:DUF4142 domain-containing protein n=1 Tax=Pseudonocardia bannensis TaxID=630973 RepID=A0A848DIV9_9PSEU|nr:DUF4142 domain-containing protein [Pseudonocardia bannensis]NMH92628.1 DUF4142 domain-containing protein [Pseudonocardia bannensis]
MLRRIPRAVRWSVLAAIIVAVAASVFQSWTFGPGSGFSDRRVQTETGVLGPADRELLVKVRQAGLWEIPTGQQMQQQATSEDVRELGGILAAEHTELDGIVRATAGQLGVVLPSLPSDQQQGWMAEIAAQTGSQYDRVAVNRLRQAHGTVLPVIAQVRTGTRNQAIRDFADIAQVFVARHIEHLESTGLVDYEALPEPQLETTPAPLANRDVSDLVVPGIVFLGLVGTVIGLLRTLRGRQGERRSDRRDGRRTSSEVVLPAPRLAPEQGPRHSIGRNATSQYPLGRSVDPLRSLDQDEAMSGRRRS